MSARTRNLRHWLIFAWYVLLLISCIGLLVAAFVQGAQGDYAQACFYLLIVLTADAQFGMKS